MVGLLRFLKHRWWDERDARRVLDEAALQRLQQRVADSERRHTGQIRVCVEASLPLSYLWRDGNIRERALSLFGKLRVWDTEHNNGVLIYVLLVEHDIEIIADRGLARHIAPDQWQPLVAHMAQAFAQGRFEEGLARAIDEVGALLERHFPAPAGRSGVNELPDPVVDLRR
jgi:uncharacterized membrane protein